MGYQYYRAVLGADFGDDGPHKSLGLRVDARSHFISEYDRGAAYHRYGHAQLPLISSTVCTGDDVSEFGQLHLPD